MSKFECLRCGNCCKVFIGDSTKHLNGSEFIDNNSFLLNKQGLKLYDWEVESFQKELDRIKSSRKIVPSIVLFDLKNKKQINVNYTVEGGNCPFYDSKCMIYSKRPLICRQYPCVQDLSFLMTGDKHSLKKNVFCEGEKKDSFPYDVKENENLFEVLKYRYGNSFYLNLADQRFRMTIMAMAKDLKFAKKGYDVKHLMKRVNSFELIDFSSFFNSLTGNDVKDIFDIEEIKKVF